MLYMSQDSNNRHWVLKVSECSQDNEELRTRLSAGVQYSYKPIEEVLSQLAGEILQSVDGLGQATYRCLIDTINR